MKNKKKYWRAAAIAVLCFIRNEIEKKKKRSMLGAKKEKWNITFQTDKDFFWSCSWLFFSISLSFSISFGLKIKCRRVLRFFSHPFFLCRIVVTALLFESALKLAILDIFTNLLRSFLKQLFSDYLKLDIVNNFDEAWILNSFFTIFFFANCQFFFWIELLSSST